MAARLGETIGRWIGKAEETAVPPSFDAQIKEFYEDPRYWHLTVPNFSYPDGPEDRRKFRKSEMSIEEMPDSLRSVLGFHFLANPELLHSAENLVNDYEFGVYYQEADDVHTQQACVILTRYTPIAGDPRSYEFLKFVSTNGTVSVSHHIRGDETEIRLRHESDQPHPTILHNEATITPLQNITNLYHQAARDIADLLFTVAR